MSVTTTLASLTVAGGSSLTAIGIAAPVDTQYLAPELKVRVTGLPTDGTIYLSDGVTPVLPGDLLIVAELTGLAFAGGANATGQSAEFTYQVTDPAGASAAGTATLSVVANTNGPQTSPASLTVAANSAATSINIAAPTDPNYSASDLTIKVLGLPPDGSVVLADGLTTVTAGQSLTVAQLTGLKFTPNAGVVAQSSLFSYTVTDPAGGSSLGSAILSIAPAGNILTVGPGKQYSTIAEAIAASQNGDTIQVQAGTYVNDFAAIDTNITLEGVGGMVNMVCTELIPNGKAIFVTNGDITINNFSFSGAQVDDANGAGIRYESGNLILNNDAFFGNEDGLLGGSGGVGSITINNSEFADNGIGDGFTHNLYVGEVGTLTVSNSYFHDANVGHEIKSRALNTTIKNSRIYDGPAGTASYSIDLPNGGNAVIQNNVIEKGPLAENAVIITMGEEGNVYASTSLTVSGNSILNDLSSSSSLAVRNNTTATAQIAGNQFFGLTSDQVVSGPNAQSNNQFLASEPALDTTQPWSPESGTLILSSTEVISAAGPGSSAILGDAGDRISGSAGDGVSTIVGAKGDTITGGSTNLINGIAGPESIAGGTRSTIVWGGAGDTILGGTGALSVDGTLGGQPIAAGSSGSTILGGAGDTITGSTGTGASTVIGVTGDTITGGTGTDLLNGIAGSQSITGGSGITTVWGGPGDTITGGQGQLAVAIDHTNFPGAELVGDNGVTGSDTVTGFSQSAGDRIFFPNETTASINSVVASAQTSNGNTLITLPDGATMTLVGIAKIDSNFL